VEVACPLYYLGGTIMAENRTPILEHGDILQDLLRDEATTRTGAFCLGLITAISIAAETFPPRTLCETIARCPSPVDAIWMCDQLLEEMAKPVS